MISPRLLWVDDDGHRRFGYEDLRIRRAGWDLVWGTDLRAAADRMCTEIFHALILDQKIPYRGLQDVPGHWGGCLFLRWLRGAGPPPGLTLPPVAPSLDLFQVTPRLENRAIPAILVSVYHRNDIMEATRSASSQDAEITLVAKPVQVEQILDFLGTVRPS